MKQTARIISTYAADVSGVASALFELGGMTVLHDASGCNSTYNTHDEPRWYGSDSLVFISAMTEADAIMGGDDKLTADIITSANELRPAFIAIAGTPVPMIIGTDFDAVASAVEKSTGIPAFGIKTNGMHSYLSGAGAAFERIARRFCDKTAKRSIGSGKVNVLGLTPLDFSVNGSDKSILGFLSDNGFEPLSAWAMGGELEQMKRAGEADVNLVVSYTGVPAARYLQKTFGTPFVVGVPIGEKFSAVLADALRKAVSSAPYTARQNKKADVVIIGESVYSGSLAAAIEAERGIYCRVVCPLETEKAFLSENDTAAPDEDAISAELDAEIIIADPLYKPVCPEKSRFYPLPSEAFSGRIYRKNIPNLIDKKL